MTYIATKLDYIQSLIDEGNTVVVQNQRYNWAGPVHRVITEKDKDMGEGFFISEWWNKATRKPGKIGPYSKKSIDKLHIVKLSDKNYEVYHSEKDYLTKPRIEKTSKWYDDLEAHKKLNAFTYFYTYTISNPNERLKKNRVRNSGVSMSGPTEPDLNEVFDSVSNSVKHLGVVSNLKLECVRTWEEENTHQLAR
jgi:hypothetical protein